MEEEKKEDLPAQAGKTGSGLEPNIAGALSYLFGFITGILFLLIEKENKFVRFHAMQSTVTCLAIIILNFVLGITLVGIALVPFLGLGTLALFIFLIYKAYMNEYYKLPVLGDLSESFLQKI